MKFIIFIAKFVKMNVLICSDNYIKILKIILPVLPHFASECLDELGASSDIKWPIVNQDYLEKY